MLVMGGLPKAHRASSLFTPTMARSSGTRRPARRQARLTITARASSAASTPQGLGGLASHRTSLRRNSCHAAAVGTEDGFVAGFGEHGAQGGQV